MPARRRLFETFESLHHRYETARRVDDQEWLDDGERCIQLQLARNSARVVPWPAAGSTLPRSIAERRSLAIGLTPPERLGSMWNFFRGVERGVPGAPIDDARRGRWLEGTDIGMGRNVDQFEQWLERSGRLDPSRGSAWWKAVDGSMLLDMNAAARLIGMNGAAARSNDAAIQGWVEYARAAGVRTLPRSERQQLLWRAHQSSIHSAIRANADLLAAEPAGERRFVANTIRSLDTVALANWPTDRRFRADLVFGAYLGIAFPRSYPASAARVALSELRADRPPFSIGFGRPDDIGLGSTRW